MGTLKEYLAKNESKDQLDEGNIGTARDLSSPFLHTLPNGDVGVGIKVDGKTYGLTADQAIKWAKELQIISKQALKK
jgi:hypothetical protein